MSRMPAGWPSRGSTRAAQGIEAFGFVVPNRVLGNALWAQIRDTAAISVRMPDTVATVSADAEGVTLTLASGGCHCAAAAGGRPPMARTRPCAVHAGITATAADYGQVAIVANVATDVAHTGTAYERFTAAGPLALVPLRDGSYTVVWARHPERCGTVAGCHR